MKKGRLSKEDMSFIEAKAEVLSPEAIAEHLDRDPDSIRDWIKRNVGFSPSQKKEAAVANELKEKPYYKELSKQFSGEELEMFEFHFKKMWSQFKEDVFHTEEMQIIETLSKDYKDLQSRKATMLKDLKGTREQRVRAIEDSKFTFASLVKKIATDPQYRNELGIEMEKMRLAMENEKERLSEYMSFNDGQVDQPFLTSETAKEEK